MFSDVSNNIARTRDDGGCSDRWFPYYGSANGGTLFLEMRRVAGKDEG